MGARGPALSEFSTLSKYYKNDWPWPTSRIDYWNLHVGTCHDVELLFPFRIEFPLSKRLVVISDKADLFKAMTTELNQVYTDVQGNSMAPEKLKEGVMVVVWSSVQKSFIRARIVSKERDCNFRLDAFDYGEMIEVHGNEIYPMCTLFLKLMPRTIAIYLDGLERFDRLGLLKSIMKSKIEFSGSRWTMEVTRMGQEKLFCKLFRVGGVAGSDASLNHILLKELWTRTPEPQLPAIDSSKLHGFVVNIQQEGKVCIQFDSPYYAAFQDFVNSAKKTLDSIVLDEEAFANKRARLPLDPNEIYMAPYGQMYDFFRAKYIPDHKTPPGKVRLRFIDYGNEEIEGVENILVAREINYYLSIAPPQCIEAQLVNVLSVDVNDAYEIIGDDNTAVIVRTVDLGDESTLPQVQVLMPKFEERTKFVEQVCFSTLLDERGLAKLTEIPHPRTHSRMQEEFSPLEYIEMINSTTWTVNAPSNMTIVVAPTILSCDQTIFFHIDYIPDSPSFAKTFTDDSLKQRHRRNAVEFTIQPVGAREVIREISRLILAHIKEPWYKQMKKTCNFGSIDKGGYYAYYCNEKSRYYRARLDTATGIRDKQARVLLIDFAKYLEDFDVSELEISIPLTVCHMGPQAASVHHVRIRDNSYFSPDDPGFQTANSDPVGWREKICAFKRVYQVNDKICSAKIVGISHDNNGVTSFALDDLKVVNFT